MVRYKDFIRSLPPVWDDVSLVDEIRSIHRAGRKKWIVLDDDPTGVQTVQGIFVLTRWDKEMIQEAFLSPEPLFFILTNTRGFVASEARAINKEIAEVICSIAKEEGIEFGIISRSDSTLRGHYPLEIDTLSEEIGRSLGISYDGHLIVPAFFEAGRFTHHNRHYLLDQERMVPVHQTEFAQDSTFGFTNSNLCDWVEEKTAGRTAAQACLSISIELLRKGPDAVEACLLEVEGNVPVIVDAVEYPDLDVLSLALLRAESKGKRFLYRTAASFIKSFGGYASRALLNGAELTAKEGREHGGIVLAGSHVQKTTNQLEKLITGTDITALTLDVQQILDSETRGDHIRGIIVQSNKELSSGNNVVVLSSRKLVKGKDREGHLLISRFVSEALIEIVQSLKITPRFIIAKGGITSSDVATKGLNIRKAQVIGQAAPGVPVWLTGMEAKFPCMPYMVFPGNVGNETTLLEIVQRISES